MRSDCEWIAPEWVHGEIKRKKLWSEHDAEWLEKIRSSYERWRTMRKDTKGSEKIPKKLHQIWLGPHAIPFEKYRRSWQEKHPEWEYTLWRDEEIKSLGLGEVYNRAANYGEKSDIARYHILHRFGGIYLDIDMEPIASLRPLLELDCFAGFSNVGVIEINNAVIGAIPGHPLLSACISNLVAGKEPPALVSMLLTGFITPDEAACFHREHHADIIQRTGPGFFTRLFCTHADDSSMICLPSEVFYSAPNDTRYDDEKRRTFLTPHSLALHHWACTWQESESKK